MALGPDDAEHPEFDGAQRDLSRQASTAAHTTQDDGGFYFCAVHSEGQWVGAVHARTAAVAVLQVASCTYTQSHTGLRWHRFDLRVQRI